MRCFFRFAFLLIGGLWGIAASDLGEARGRQPPAERDDRAPATATPGRYDYYLMALSWSPTFCRSHPDEREQCARQGYGFVLHGLWPQYERGYGPERCATDAAPDARTVERALPFMPSRRLVHHQWRKHGSCSGLSPAAYFERADRAFASIRIPDLLKAPRRRLDIDAARLRHEFARANPGLDASMYSLHCSQGELVEVRICLDKDDLAPRRCGRRMRSGCPVDGEFAIPAVR